MSSIGQWVGTVLGGLVGFLIGGWTGLFYGAVIGYTIGGYISPIKPDVKQTGGPIHGIQFNSNTIGVPIPDVIGTTKISGQLLFFGKEFRKAIKEKVGKRKKAVVGYKYYCSWGVGICMGPVDSIYTIFEDQEPIWSEEITRPTSGGEVTIYIEDFGNVTLYFGTDDQMPNPKLEGIIPDLSLNTGYRHLCWAFFDACYLGETNRIPSMSFIVKKTPPLFSNGNKEIAVFDANPMHAIWYILVNKVGLPEEWLDSNDFLNTAEKLLSEVRGISILFSNYQPAMDYIEAINEHIDNIFYLGSDGKLHPKLIRYDYEPNNLPMLDESILIEEPSFSRRAWIDTINEVKVQYSEILGERELPWTYKLYDNFHIFDIYLDFPYIYACGRGYDAGISRPKVGKINIYSGQMVDVYMDTTKKGYYKNLYVDDQGVYIIGGQTVGSVQQSFVHKRKKDNLNDLLWSYAPSATGHEPADIVGDDNYIYMGYGRLYNQTCGIAKLNKTAGTVAWHKTIQPATAIRGMYSHIYLILAKEHGGVNVISQANKITGGVTDYTFTTGWPAGGRGKGNYFWVGGFRFTIGRTIVKYDISKTPIEKIWAWEEQYGTTFYFRRAFGDDNGVYAMGLGDFETSGRIIKLNTAGTQKLWEKTLDTYEFCFEGLAELGGVLYIGSYFVGGEHDGKGRIHKRNKADGELTGKVQ